ncbi:S26 family signal peptidase, partial [Micromonospora fluostatini]
GLYRVEGTSMEPALPEGTLALGVRAGRISPGDVVVIRDPFGPGLVVKRVDSAQQRGRVLWLVGDNPVGTVDSRAWGWVASSRVRARVVLAVKR